jgi:hypothetical protein
MNKVATVQRDARGRVMPGSTLNVEGRNGNGPKRELEEAARALFDAEATPEELEALGVPHGAIVLLGRMEAPTFGAAILAVLTAAALEGDLHARRDLLARVWPAPKPVELSVDGNSGPIVFSWKAPAKAVESRSDSTP